MTKQFKLQPLIFIGLGIAVFIIVLSRQCCQPSPLPLSEAIIVSQFEELVEGDFEQGANFFRNNMMAEGEILLNSPLTGKQAVFSLEEFLGYRSNFERVSLYFISSAFFDKITELTILELPKAPFISQLLGALADQDIPDQERRKYADQLLLIIEKTAEVSIGGKKLAFNTYLEGLYHGTTPPGEVASLGDLRSSKYGSLFINPAIAGYIPKQENPPTLVPKGGTKTRPYIPEYPPDTIILSKPTSVDTSTTQPPQPSFDEEAFKDRIKGILEKNFKVEIYVFNDADSYGTNKIFTSFYSISFILYVITFYICFIFFFFFFF